MNEKQNKIQQELQKQEEQWKKTKNKPKTTKPIYDEHTLTQLEKEELEYKKHEHEQLTNEFKEAKQKQQKINEIKQLDDLYLTVVFSG